MSSFSYSDIFLKSKYFLGFYFTFLSSLFFIGNYLSRSLLRKYQSNSSLMFSSGIDEGGLGMNVSVLSILFANLLVRLNLSSSASNYALRFALLSISSNSNEGFHCSFVINGLIRRGGGF